MCKNVSNEGYIIISYTYDTEMFARKLVDYLRHFHLNVFINKDIETNMKWKSHFNKVLKNSKVIVFLIGNEYNRYSEYVLRKIVEDIWSDHDRIFLPLIITDAAHKDYPKTAIYEKIPAFLKMYNLLIVRNDIDGAKEAALYIYKVSSNKSCINNLNKEHPINEWIDRYSYIKSEIDSLESQKRANKSKYENHYTHLIHEYTDSEASLRGLNTAKHLLNQAMIKKSQKDFDAAEQLLFKALNIYESYYNETDPRIISVVKKLGYLQKEKGDLDGAAKQFQRSLKAEESLNGSDNPNLARDLRILASTLQDKGDLNNAKNFFEKALKIDQRSYEPNHPYLLIDFYNLGNVLQAQGDFEEARKNFEKALEIGMSIYGSDHPKLVGNLNKLGNISLAQGDFEEARKNFEKVLEINTKVYGPDHPNLTDDLSNLGQVQKELGDVQGAIESYEKALKIMEKNWESSSTKLDILRSKIQSLREKN